MEDICERVYNSPQFYINREKLINKGKSKEAIFNIIKIHLSNISTKTHDLDTVVKSQIIEILNEFGMSVSLSIPNILVFIISFLN